ncbi:hypothetical protein [Pseudoclavibacter sp. 8L]|uniref:hypothetical protein n=1 Tax=Pseudoclavibacter sp. 8L TaxID=2653162 RepID=UPI0012F273BD|nr:hypothetical protein [Pseudoclavibacter sp. 8L]VXB29483.1 conserved hypothetical protein [Pseudoclavibacter sp. 8L]
MEAELTYLTTRAAARRVGRSVRTIRRWRRAGLAWRVHDHLIEIEKEELLRMWRRMTFQNPIVLKKLRARGEKVPDLV